MKEGRKPEYLEKAPSNELQKMPHTKARRFKPKARLKPAQLHWWQTRKADMLTVTPHVTPIAEEICKRWQDLEWNQLACSRPRCLEKICWRLILEWGAKNPNNGDADGGDDGDDDGGDDGDGDGDNDDFDDGDDDNDGNGDNDGDDDGGDDGDSDGDGDNDDFDDGDGDNDDNGDNDGDDDGDDDSDDNGDDNGDDDGVCGCAGNKVLGMPAPSSGPVVALMLNMMEGFNWTASSVSNPKTYQQMIEVPVTIFVTWNSSSFFLLLRSQLDLWCLPFFWRDFCLCDHFCHLKFFFILFFFFFFFCVPS